MTSHCRNLPLLVDELFVGSSCSPIFIIIFCKRHVGEWYTGTIENHDEKMPITRHTFQQIVKNMAEIQHQNPHFYCVCNTRKASVFTVFSCVPSVPSDRLRWMLK
jgi:hypothetical protein